jgi:dicarboxylate transporter 10
MLLDTKYFSDNVVTHFTASLSAGTIATLISQPLDVFKTRLMNSKPGEFKTLAALFRYTQRTGVKGFFKGFFPAWIRLGPQTILTFMFFEQLKQRLGDEVPA